MLCRDIELACDEKVVKDMDTEGKKLYSEALLSCSIPRRMISACPLAFGEAGVKMRVRSVLNYKKTTFWVILAAVCVCVVIAVCFLTNPAPESIVEEPLPEESAVLPEPPTLKISYRGKEMETSTLTYSWYVTNGDEIGSGVEADAPHPLDIVESLPVMQIDYGSNQVLLEFETEPDELIIRAWNISHDMDRNTYDTNDIKLEYEKYGDHLVTIPMDGNYVYNIAGTWNADRYKGNASYSFVTKWREYSEDEWSLTELESPAGKSKAIVSAADLYVEGDENAKYAFELLKEY